MKKEKQKLENKEPSGGKFIPLVKLTPNIVTLLNLCVGVSAIRYALVGRIELAVVLILFAAFLDAIDGRLARLLHADSKFGAQLDSLADIVSFGVAPAMMVYFFSLSQIPFKGVGWGVALFYISCSALRLARFNVMSEEPEEEKGKNYFVGMPIPAAAVLSLQPIILSFDFLDSPLSPYVCVIYIMLIAIIMASRLPTFSAKNIKIRKELAPFVMMAIALIIVLFIIEHWLVLPLFSLIYILCIPVSCYCFYKKKIS